MQSSQTKPLASVNLNNESRKFANSIAVFIICLSAIVIGQGCVNLKNAKSFEIDSPFVAIEYEALEADE